MDYVKPPLLRAQFYHEEAQRLREQAAAEDKRHRRKILQEIADSYDETAFRLIEEATGKAE